MSAPATAAKAIEDCARCSETMRCPSVEIMTTIIENALADAVTEERNRIRANIVCDMATGAGDYSEAEDYAEKMVRP